MLVVPLLHIHVWGSTGVHRLWARPCFSSSVPACLVRRTCIVFCDGGASVRIVGVSWGVVARTCLILLSTFLYNFCPSLLSSRFVSVHVVHPYSSIDTTAAWKKLRFILSVRSDFHMIESLSIAVHCLRQSCVDVFLGWWDAAS